jgi:AcrR family transcriptional regulator
MSTPVRTLTNMPATRGRRRKAPVRYHHGDLRRALLVEAARTIHKDGVEAFTLRSVGERLGVSRTALYRHFADKSALLAAVAREGFQRFGADLTQAWTGAGGGVAGFNAMGTAYVRFAMENSAHYRVMFGDFLNLSACDPELKADASAAFQVLMSALVALREQGLARPDDPLQQAHFIWGSVHGIAMLAIDGQLGPDPSVADSLTTFSLERLRTGIMSNS